jgi:hypothetical protein
LVVNEELVDANIRLLRKQVANTRGLAGERADLVLQRKVTDCAEFIVKWMALVLLDLIAFSACRNTYEIHFCSGIGTLLGHFRRRSR